MTTPGGTGFPGQIQARDSVTLVPLDLYGDEATGTLKVAQYCYNPDTLAWERMRQPVGQYLMVALNVGNTFEDVLGFQKLKPEE